MFSAAKADTCCRAETALGLAHRNAPIGEEGCGWRTASQRTPEVHAGLKGARQLRHCVIVTPSQAREAKSIGLRLPGQFISCWRLAAKRCGQGTFALLHDA